MSRPLRIRTSVVFPAPFGPRSARTWPGATDSETSSSTRLPSKLRETPRASSAATGDAAGDAAGAGASTGSSHTSSIVRAEAEERMGDREVLRPQVRAEVEVLALERLVQALVIHAAEPVLGRGEPAA